MLMLTRVRNLPSPLWALFAGTFINRFGTFVVPFLVLYLTKTGYTLPQAGLAASMYGIGGMLASSVGGILADSLGRRISIAISMFGSAATMLLLSQARALPIIMALTLLAAATSELYRPAAGALIADLIPAGERVTGFALYRLMINAGVAIGVALAGFLADRSFLLLFVGDALSSVIYGMIALAALPKEKPSYHAGNRTATSRAALRHIAADRRFMLYLLATVLGAFVYVQHLSTVGLQVRADGLPSSVYGLLLSANGFIILLCEVPLTAWTQRHPAPVMMAAGTLCVGLGFTLTGFITTFPALLITVAIWTLGEMLTSPVASAYVADIAPPEMQGRYQGIAGMTFGLAFILAPTLGTWLFAWNAKGLWLICGAVCVLSAGILYTMQRSARN
jgi:MFS family permease